MFEKAILICQTVITDTITIGKNIFLIRVCHIKREFVIFDVLYYSSTLR